MTRCTDPHRPVRTARRGIRASHYALSLAMLCAALPGPLSAIAAAAPTATTPAVATTAAAASTDAMPSAPSPSAATSAAMPNAAAPVAGGGLVLKSGGQELWVAGLKSLAIAVLALAATTASLFWLRNRFRPVRSAEHPLHAPTVLTSRRASQKTLLLVVQWEGRAYLLAESAGATQLIDRRDLPAHVQPNPSGPLPANGSQTS